MVNEVCIKIVLGAPMLIHHGMNLLSRINYHGKLLMSIDFSKLALSIGSEMRRGFIMNINLNELYFLLSSHVIAVH